MSEPLPPTPTRFIWTCGPEYSEGGLRKAIITYAIVPASEPTALFAERALGGTSEPSAIAADGSLIVAETGPITTKDFAYKLQQRFSRIGNPLGEADRLSDEPCSHVSVTALDEHSLVVATDMRFQKHEDHQDHGLQEVIAELVSNMALPRSAYAVSTASGSPAAL